MSLDFIYALSISQNQMFRFQIVIQAAGCAASDQRGGIVGVGAHVARAGFEADGIGRDAAVGSVGDLGETVEHAARAAAARGFGEIAPDGRAARQSYAEKTQNAIQIVLPGGY